MTYKPQMEIHIERFNGFRWSEAGIYFPVFVNYVKITSFEFKRMRDVSLVSENIGSSTSLDCGRRSTGLQVQYSYKFELFCSVS